MSARERAKDIAALTANGLTSREVAKEMGISHVRVCAIADRFSIPLSRPGSRRFGCYISDRRARLIRELAREAKVSPATMIERITRVVLDDGIDPARKRLGKLAVEASTYKQGSAHA
ncbi:hypothetical protein AB4Z40_08695 [Bosea sp. 2YAB26]|uniref:hypothetical protein n=1 Tax=Bosea sp. 2YAB26 TaxID=3237478 RepID=UPI003F9175B2